MRGLKRGKITIIVLKSVNPSLRYVLSLYLLEISPLVFAGRLRKRQRDALVETMTTDGRMDAASASILVEDASIEQGFRVIYGGSREFAEEVDGLFVSIRRRRELESWEMILGKTIPKPYSLIKHLLDAAAVASKMWTLMLSPHQRETIRLLLGVDDVDDKAIKDIIVYLAGMHDIGKASPAWQKRVLGATADDIRYQPLPFPDSPDGDAPYHHDVLGREYALYERSTSSPDDYGILSALSVVALGHHGNFDSNAPDERQLVGNDIIAPDWLEQQRDIERCVCSTTLSSQTRPVLPKKVGDKDVYLLLEGIVIFADWVASQSSFIEGMEETSDYRQHYENALARAGSFIESAGLECPRWKGVVSEWSQANPNIPFPNAFQKTVVETATGTPGLLFLSAPMGMGKTEASIFAATKWGSTIKNSGLYFALPTQDTSNAMFQRIVVPDKSRASLGDTVFDGRFSVALLHSNSISARFLDSIKDVYPAPPADDGNNSYTSSSSPSEVEDNAFIADYLILRKLGGFSDIAVGTVDPVLDVSVPLKHNALRWLALSGKVLVLDEIHSFDAYTTTLINNLVSWCARLRIPIICMTATLGEGAQKALVSSYIDGLVLDRDLRREVASKVESIFRDNEGGLPSPSALAVSWDGSVAFNPVDVVDKVPTEYDVSIVHTGRPVKETPLVVSEDVIGNVTSDPDKSRLIIMNTVASAITVYTELKNSDTINCEVDVLHSRMPSSMKSRIVARALRRTNSEERTPYILISTQVAEASFDVDFDELYTPIAPADSILQRSGRVMRKRSEVGKITIYVPKELDSLVESGESVDKETFLPYTEWGVASSLVALTKVCGGDNAHIALKDHIDDIYALLDDPSMFPALWASEVDDEESKTSRAFNVGVPQPGRMRRLSEMTSMDTSRKKTRTPVRLIRESVVILPIYKVRGEWKVKTVGSNGGQKMVKLPEYGDKRSRIFYAENSFSVPKYFLDKKFQDIPVDVRDRYMVPNYIVAVDFTDVNEMAYSIGDGKVGFDDRSM